MPTAEHVPSSDVLEVLILDHRVLERLFDDVKVGRAPGLRCIAAAGCLDRCTTRICARAKGYKPPAVFWPARRPRRRVEERA